MCNGSVLSRRVDGEDKYICSPYVSSNKQEIEHFYNVELDCSGHCRNNDHRVDFNCALTNTNCTGNTNFSRSLEKVVHGFGLVDVCGTVSPRAVYKHYTPNGAVRLDRIYVISKLSDQKVGVKTVFVAFTDHLAVCQGIMLEVPFYNEAGVCGI